jgi:outer membrane phospholipase A
MLATLYHLILLASLCFGSTVGFSQQAEIPAPLAPPLQISTQVEPKLERVTDQEDENIYRHRDIYFLAGRPNSKVQISLKLKPVHNFDLYVAYTQLMFWDLGEESSPFADINFQPELFYSWAIDQNGLKGIDFGLEHRSNGKDGLESRSFDRGFVQFRSQLGYGTYRLRWDLRLFWVYDIDWETSGNIRDYMGFWESRLTLDSLIEQYFPAKGEVYLQFHPGGALNTQFSRGAIEVGIKYRVRLFKIMPHLMFQYYYGSMESMLTYDNKSHSYRVGFTF